nr:MAG TPA: hypothetical protein [Bacteriophage sp.]
MLRFSITDIRYTPFCNPSCFQDLTSSCLWFPLRV